MSSNPQPSITQLFTSFLRLGITAFGGPSMVAYIRRMAVEKKRWLDAEAFSDGVALCQMITVTIRFALNVQWDLSHLLLVSSALLALLLKVDILWVVVI